MLKLGYETIKMVERSAKPRSVGITMTADPGMGLLTLRDLLETWGAYIDYSKLYHTTPAVLSEKLLEDKASLYKANNVYMMAGGIYLELAFCQRNVENAIAYLRDKGFGAVEVSENFVDIPAEEKRSIVQKCLKAGLRVTYEYGEKYYDSSKDLTPEEVAKGVMPVKEMGVHHTIIEESVMDLWLGKDGNGKNANRIVELADRVGREHIVLETATAAQHALAIQLLGPDVNLGPNIQPDQISWLESGRRGIGRAFGYQAVLDAYATYKKKR